MKLITEEINKVEFIVEENNGKQSCFIEGNFLQGNIKNRNGRVYRTETLAREVARYNEQYVQNGRALGELGHPDGPTVNLDRVSHNIISLRQEGNNFIGKAKLLDTPMGNIAKSLIGEGVKLGVSSRGVGSISETKQGYKLVGEDFMLATAADIVADPSAPDAFVQGIMEGKEWVFVNGLLRESDIKSTQSTIDKLVVTRELEEKKVQLFQDFLSNL
ncbi:prohead core scaffold protein [Synechococcus phage ACG-2014f]|uniref:Prohead core scaffold protein n=3 Tax=Atlauavirus TaxID=2733092 RepID=A0A0E3I725_9CAUD|nr:head maturation protease [Synechococcus phage ACG-2014f_Syn7803C8]YP_009778856.1 head maturation protease [Synechococcus phage ACG-2014f_Syn7803US26]AIX27489.1 prohead core scaffold protein [Synechococcus phage ACG-2014f]AIX21461.1 prohead core scaffold protein [Synechococcus phage ACG-2014f_Syn7803C8]AIX28982.1 prohead core scaffold protein [Synechococcus phage ACG-2014f_Syn7803US26]AIX29531.1 prohead core scaffold protein [Synechococcus phage ACG-2014f]AIX31479.1 prohead core scaffold pr